MTTNMLISDTRFCTSPYSKMTSSNDSLLTLFLTLTHWVTRKSAQRQS